jgi:hypothetical protein
LDLLGGFPDWFSCRVRCGKPCSCRYWYCRWHWLAQAAPLGIYLGAAFFLAQLVHIFTPTFQWSFTLGFNLNISLGWLSSGELGLNLFALAMLLWVGARAFAADNWSKTGGSAAA